MAYRSSWRRSRALLNTIRYLGTPATNRSYKTYRTYKTYPTEDTYGVIASKILG
jgi:hypothetical protein